MSEEVLLKRSEAEAIAAEMKQASLDAADRFATTRGRLNELAESFRGSAATAFDNQYQQWDEGSRQVVDALNDLGEWLNGAITSLADTDAQLAGGLSGG